MALTRPLADVAAVAFVILGLLVLLSDCAHACECAMFPGSQQELAKYALSDSAAVFSGEVLAIEERLRTSAEGLVEEGSGSTTVALRVSEVWKGPERATLEVSTPSSDAACGYSFKEGQKYLVYAYGKEEPFKVNSCGETTPLSEASADLQVLGNGETLGGSGVLSDTSGGFPPLGEIGMLGGAVAAVSLVVLMWLVRTG